MARRLVLPKGSGSFLHAGPGHQTTRGYCTKQPRLVPMSQASLYHDPVYLRRPRLHGQPLTHALPPILSEHGQRCALLAWRLAPGCGTGTQAGCCFGACTQNANTGPGRGSAYQPAEALRGALQESTLLGALSNALHTHTRTHTHIHTHTHTHTRARAQVARQTQHTRAAWGLRREVRCWANQALHPCAFPFLGMCKHNALLHLPSAGQCRAWV